MYELHVMGPMRLMRAAAPRMAARGGGRIVNVCSSAGKRPSLNNAAYSVTKAAQLSLSRLFADTYAAQGVLVNAVAPGATRSELWTADGGIADQIAAARGSDARRGARRPRPRRSRSAASPSRGDRRRDRVPVLGAGQHRDRRRVVGGRRVGCDHHLTRSPRRSATGCRATRRIACGAAACCSARSAC